MSSVNNQEMKDIFLSASKFLFSKISADESLAINFSGEESEFLRLNHGKIRQLTQVEQINLNLEIQWNGRVYSQGLNLSSDRIKNEALLLESLTEIQKTIREIPEDPYFIAHTNNGTSETDNQGEVPKAMEFFDALAPLVANDDLAGIFVSGPTYRGQANSQGQSHWFSSRSFFFDYSLYTAKERAVKNCYAGNKFSVEELQNNLSRAQESLKVMDREKKILSPGGYRCYLAPAAVDEILGLMGWHALSAGAHQRGDGPFMELVAKEKQLSPKFHLSEDFTLGLSPRFNEKGELAQEKLPLIKDGKLENFLVSSATAKEYNLSSNFAESSEAPRSPVIAPGSLKEEDILKKLGTGIYLSNLHYLNWSDKVKGRFTGMTRFGCLWVENGIIQGPIKDLRFDETLYQIFGNALEELTDFQEVAVSTGTYEERNIGGSKMPGALVSAMRFTL